MGGVETGGQDLQNHSFMSRPGMMSILKKGG